RRVGQAVLAKDLRVELQRRAGVAPGGIRNLRPGVRHRLLRVRALDGLSLLLAVVFHQIELRSVGSWPVASHAAAQAARVQRSVRTTGVPSAEAVSSWMTSSSSDTRIDRVSTMPTFSAERAPTRRWVTLPAASSTV